MWTTVKQVHDLLFFFILFEVHKIQQISVNTFYTSKQTTIKKGDLSSVGEKGCLFMCVCTCVWACVCVRVCFGFRGAKDMIACGRWPAPLPLQKPRHVTANCHKKIKQAHTLILRVSTKPRYRNVLHHLLQENVTDRQSKNAKGLKQSHKTDRGNLK